MLMLVDMLKPVDIVRCNEWDTGFLVTSKIVRTLDEGQTRATVDVYSLNGYTISVLK